MYNAQEERKVYKKFVRRLDRKREFNKTGHRRQNNIKIDFTEVGCEGVK
jgi:hypothetical protein